MGFVAILSKPEIELSLELGSISLNKQKEYNMSIYIDSYKIDVKGISNRTTAKGAKNAPLVDKANFVSTDGMNSKAFIDMVEQIADSHDANCDVHCHITLKQHRY